MSKGFTKSQHIIIASKLIDISGNVGSISWFIRLTCHENQRLYRAAIPLCEGSTDNPLYKLQFWLDDIFRNETPFYEPIHGAYFAPRSDAHHTAGESLAAAYGKFTCELVCQKITDPAWKKPGLTLDQLQAVLVDLGMIYAKQAALGYFVTQAYQKAHEKCVLTLNTIAQLIKTVQEEMIKKEIHHPSDKLSATMHTSMKKPDEERILCFSGGAA